MFIWTQCLHQRFILRTAYSKESNPSRPAITDAWPPLATTIVLPSPPIAGVFILQLPILIYSVGVSRTAASLWQTRTRHYQFVTELQVMGLPTDSDVSGMFVPHWLRVNSLLIAFRSIYVRRSPRRPSWTRSVLMRKDRKSKWWKQP